jgi:hypothetical protein
MGKSEGSETARVLLGLRKGPKYDLGESILLELQAREALNGGRYATHRTWSLVAEVRYVTSLRKRR